jgi:hypothetical protein
LAAKFDDCDFADIDAILESKAQKEEQQEAEEELDDD